MSKSLIVYYSQSGTTEKVAISIADGLLAAGYKSDLHNIKNGKPPDTNKYNLLGIGFPVYYYRPPFNIIDYLTSLPNLSGLPVFIFLLQGTYRFDAAKQARVILNRKGAWVIGYFHCYGADYFLGYLKQGYLFSYEHPTLYELSQAQSFGYELIAYTNKETYIGSEGEMPPSLLYRIERFLLNRWLVRYFFSRTFHIDKTKCTMCGKCVKLCPVSNIVIGKDDYPVWGSKCLLCLTCEMKCPESVITSAVDWFLLRPFFWYNVRQASLDSSIDHVKVVHRFGKTLLL
jgi:flavodoxin/Pyruvate/2-oxoacid:ferredoxin oxidoreductase delta subunit